MLIAHEAPLQIMDKVQSITDYDYCLVHLLDENETYRDFFFKAKENGRRIIMDCSTYELGHAYDWEKYFDWVTKLQPDEYIIPDVFQDKNANFESFEKFLTTFPTHMIPSKRVGVIQGTSYEELVESYKFMADQADKVAISFGYDYFWQQALEQDLLENDPAINALDVKTERKPQAYSMGRYNLINKFIDDGIIDYHKKHHLLGCGTPTEFWTYGKHPDCYRYSFIESIDTSHPVVAGFFNLDYYNQINTVTKRTEKIVDIFDEPVSNDQWSTIESNVKFFKKNILCQ
jgi:hypothetical protein